VREGLRLSSDCVCLLFAKNLFKFYDKQIFKAAYKCQTIAVIAIDGLPKFKPVGNSSFFLFFHFRRPQKIILCIRQVFLEKKSTVQALFFTGCSSQTDISRYLMENNKKKEFRRLTSPLTPLFIMTSFSPYTYLQLPKAEYNFFNIILLSCGNLAREAYRTIFFSNSRLNYTKVVASR
jgi:hypothetical protein